MTNPERRLHTVPPPDADIPVPADGKDPLLGAVLNDPELVVEIIKTMRPEGPKIPDKESTV